MNGPNEALVRPGGLLDQAETVLRRALALRPHDVPTLARLGAVQRGKGDLAAALETYRRVTGLCPGHPEASWLSAVLGGAALPDVPAPEGTSPVPFVRMTDFLRLHAPCSAAQQHRLLPERLLPPDHPRARSRGRLLGRAVHGERLVVGATRRARGRG